MKILLAGCIVKPKIEKFNRFQLVLFHLNHNDELVHTSWFPRN